MSVVPWLGGISGWRVGFWAAGLAGVVVNMAEGGDLAAARWLFAVFAVLAAVGTVASYRSSRGR